MKQGHLDEFTQQLDTACSELETAVSKSNEQIALKDSIAASLEKELPHCNKQ